MILFALCRRQQTNRLSLQFLQNSEFIASTRSNSRIDIISSSYQRRSISDSSNSSSNGQWITGSLSGAKYVTKLVPPTSNVNNTKSTSTKNEARLLVSGPDASGLVASFSQLLYGLGCGIVDCTSESSEEDEYDQNVIVKNTEHKLHSRIFFQRILFDYTNINADRSLVESEIKSICQKFGMKYQLVSKSV